ncbi:MAG: 4Fe-4S dicluster domain-containing protein [Bacillota bacterium]
MCQLACSSTKGYGYNPRLALLRIEVEREGLVARPITCVQCANPFCARACPTGAIARNQEGVVVIEAGRCSGCGLCADGCFQRVIFMDGAAGKAVKCDLCGACVEACPTGALGLASCSARAKEAEQ